MVQKQVIYLLFSWSDAFRRHPNQVVRRATSHCIKWTVWTERNHWTFNDEEELTLDIINSFLRSLFGYCIVARWR